jgi:hypothetical protein
VDRSDSGNSAFHGELNSSSVEYFQNPHDEYATAHRWETGGGIDTDLYNKWGGEKSRDEDGTIDRVRDPPKELLPLLFGFKCQANAHNIALDEAFVAAGGTSYGVIPTTKFASCLAVTFHRMGLTDENIKALVTAYGIGDKAPEGSARSKIAPFESCAWCDFCEDVGKAVDVYAGSPNLPKPASQIYPRGIRY